MYSFQSKCWYSPNHLIYVLFNVGTWKGLQMQLLQGMFKYELTNNIISACMSVLLSVYLSVSLSQCFIDGYGEVLGISPWSAWWLPPFQLPSENNKAGESKINCFAPELVSAHVPSTSVLKKQKNPKSILLEHWQKSPQSTKPKRGWIPVQRD